MKTCDGCGRELTEGEKVIEVGRQWVYCVELCAITLRYHYEAA